MRMLKAPLTAEEYASRGRAKVIYRFLFRRSSIIMIISSITRHESNNYCNILLYLWNDKEVLFVTSEHMDNLVCIFGAIVKIIPYYYNKKKGKRTFLTSNTIQ